jgi:hypothetical protein
MTVDALVLLLHALVTVMMAGVIWFVQVVHYPLFGAVGDARFADYESKHTARTGRVVGPLMLVEAATAAWLVISRSPELPAGACLAGLGLVAVLWASTAFIQVPCHRRLARGFDPATWRRLVRTNWLRTACWSIRAVLALWMLAAAAPPIE